MFDVKSWSRWLLLVASVALIVACGGDDDGGGTDAGGQTTADAAAPDAAVTAAECGDGEVAGTEQCDDDNDDDSDSCRNDCRLSCGDGALAGDEICDVGIGADMPGACPTSCDDGDACTQDTLAGSDCSATCAYEAILEPAAGDGCCPEGATSATDSDCESVCGNGTREAGEACDTGVAAGMPGACPTSCDDGQSCTEDSLSGAGTCDATCANAPITSPANGDGCCPSGATVANDDDCSPGCGDGVMTPPETCDTGIASGAGACPTSCNDGNACTSDTLLSGGTCNAACSRTPITAPAAGDGCCPAGANSTTDSDCDPVCGNGVVESGEACDDGGTAGGDGCSATCQREPVAFRITDLDLRDPHVSVGLGALCLDATDTPVFGIFAVNTALQEAVQLDGDADGLFDLSIVLNFDPLDRGAPMTPLQIAVSDCTLPPSMCTPQNPAEVAATIATNMSSGTCLSPLAGTVRPYSPAVTTPSGPCFSSSATMLTISIADIPIRLSDARVGATYQGSPTSGLLNGMIRGFISEADADATVLPDSLPIVNGRPLSSLLKGGTGACGSGSDMDTGPGGVRGWYFYLNFTAQRTTYMAP